VVVVVIVMIGELSAGIMTRIGVHFGDALVDDESAELAILAWQGLCSFYLAPTSLSDLSGSPPGLFFPVHRLPLPLSPFSPLSYFYSLSVELLSQAFYCSYFPVVPFRASAKTSRGKSW